MKNMACLLFLPLLAACGSGKPDRQTAEGIFTNVMALQMAKVNFAYRAAHPSAGTPMALDELQRQYADHITAKQQGDCFHSHNHKDQPEVFQCVIHFEWADFEVNGIQVPADSGDAAIEIIKEDSEWQVYRDKPKGSTDLEI